MQINEREVGPNAPPLVVAEIGINHGGSLDVAKAMVDAAASSGCEMVKHQTHFVDDEMTPEAQAVVPPNSDQSIWDIMEECALTRDDEVALKRYAESRGMTYISTPFSRSAADFLAEIGVPAFKIGSGEADNLPLIEHVCGFGKPIIMSTGMQTIDSLRASVDVLEASGSDYALLECTNLYPSPPEVVSLQGVTELQRAFPNAVVGFSDHSIGHEMAVAAVALGACILERHFTDSRYREGPDIICSMDPPELRRLITASREVFVAAQNPKMRTEPEEAVYRFARSSVVADRSLTAGTVLTVDDVWARRPGTGEIPGSDLRRVVGRTLIRNVDRNTQLAWSDFEPQ
ncbi:MAG: N-acetylneuraminate synthase family protein [Actinomycetota bacterium]